MPAVNKGIEKLQFNQYRYSEQMLVPVHKDKDKDKGKDKDK